MDNVYCKTHRGDMGYSNTIYLLHTHILTHTAHIFISHLSYQPRTCGYVTFLSLVTSHSFSHSPFRLREGRSSAKKSKKSQDRQRTPDRHMRFDSPEERSRSRFTLKDLRNDANYRPKSSAELIEFHATKPSNRYNDLRQTLHNRFKEVHDDKAMTLHDILEQMDRERLSKCQNKFSSLQTRSMSLHRALEEMRRDGERLISRPGEVRRQSSFRGNWYTDLLQSIPSEMKQTWYYRTVLQKLGKYGLVSIS
ncbi:uncharacterized protein LOC101856806 [Aplysia californica]|uniref:Uncharacterized protein LOC101856806 n=1 Tax=Aplysia californica TaxID=6500 RepID=A0ABM1A0M3_APLCA|nr:uncharacterized protein LOC101856806 [Aplysia californica]